MPKDFSKFANSGHSVEVCQFPLLTNLQFLRPLDFSRCDTGSAAVIGVNTKDGIKMDATDDSNDTNVDVKDANSDDANDEKAGSKRRKFSEADDDDESSSNGI